MDVSRQGRLVGVKHEHYGPFKNDAGETIEGDKWFIYTASMDDLTITEWRLNQDAGDLFKLLSGQDLGHAVRVTGEIAARGNKLEHRARSVELAK